MGAEKLIIKLVEIAIEFIITVWLKVRILKRGGALMNRVYPIHKRSNNYKIDQGYWRMTRTSSTLLRPWALCLPLTE